MRFGRKNKNKLEVVNRLEELPKIRELEIFECGGMRGINSRGIVIGFPENILEYFKEYSGEHSIPCLGNLEEISEISEIRERNSDYNKLVYVIGINNSNKENPLLHYLDNLQKTEEYNLSNHIKSTSLQEIFYYKKIAKI